MSSQNLRRLAGGMAVATALLLAACGGSPTKPQQTNRANSTATTLADLAKLPDGDRETKLKAQAEKEGQLNLYTSNTDMQDIVDAFEDKYDVNVSVYQALNETVLQRLLQEDKAGYQGADVLELDGPTLDIAAAEGLLAPYKTPLRDQVVGVRELPKTWSPDRLNVFTVGWNTKLVPSGSEPTSLEDLADPKWKGKLALELGNYDWLLGLHDYYVGKGGWTEERFDEVMTGIARNAKMVKGHTVMGELLSAGQFSVAVGIYSHTIDKAAAKGAPVAWSSPSAPPVQPVVVRPNGVGVMKVAVHPAAAALFTEFLLTDGQKIVQKATRVPVVPPKGSPNPLDGVESTGVPSDELQKNGQKWSDRYEALLENATPS